MDCSLPGSSIHGIFQAIVLEWVAISFSRRSSRPRDWTQVSRVVGRRFTVWAAKEALSQYLRVLVDGKWNALPAHRTPAPPPVCEQPRLEYKVFVQTCHLKNGWLHTSPPLPSVGTASPICLERMQWRKVKKAVFGPVPSLLKLGLPFLLRQVLVPHLLSALGQATCTHSHSKVIVWI